MGCSVLSPEETGEGSSALADDPRPRLGSTITSPSIDPARTYWGAREIGFLTMVGVDPVVVRVADRADGILGHAPANGRIGVDELASLESSAHVGSLFPEERAAIPLLWKLLEITDDGVHAPAATTIPVEVHGDYTTARSALTISRLPQNLQSLARRIELSHDADGDPDTISGPDVNAADQRQSSYLPTEISLFPDLHAWIVSSSPLPIGAQYVEIPAGRSQVVGSSGPFDLVEVAEPSTPEAGWQGSTVLTAFTRYALVRKRPGDLAIVFERETGEATIVGDVSELPLDKASRVEVWRGGARIGHFATAAATKATAEVPYGYSVKIGASTYHLACGNGSCTYRENPELQDAPGGVYRTRGDDEYRIHVFPNGRAILRRGSLEVTCYPSEVTRGCSTRSDAAIVGSLDYRAPYGISFGAFISDSEGGRLYKLYVD